MLKNRIFHNAMALAILQIVNYAAPLVILVYLTKILGVDLYGVVAFSIGIVQLSFVVMDFGFSMSATEKISVHRAKKIYISRLLGSIFVIKFAILFLVSLLMLLYALLNEKYADYFWLFVFSLLPIMGQGFLPTWFFQGVERMKFITFFSICSKLIFVFCIIFLVSKKEDYLWIPLASGIAQLSALIVAVFLIYSIGYSVSKPRRRDIRYTVKFTLHFFYSRVSVATYMSSATVVLGAVATPATVAIYSLAEQLYRVMQSAFSPIVQAIYPYMVKERDVGLLFKISVICTILAAFCTLIGYLFSPYLLSLLFGDAWSASLPVLNIFFGAVLVHVAAVMAGYPLAAAVGSVRTANTTVIAGSFVYFVLMAIVLVSETLTPVSLAIVMVVSESYVLIHRATALMPKAINQYSKCKA